MGAFFGARMKMQQSTILSFAYFLPCSLPLFFSIYLPLCLVRGVVLKWVGGIKSKGLGKMKVRLPWAFDYVLRGMQT